MKWNKIVYDSINGYVKYVSEGYTIMRTHDRNMLTGKEMSPQYQYYEILKGTIEVGRRNTLKEAKRFAEEKKDIKYFDLGNFAASLEPTASGNFKIKVAIKSNSYETQIVVFETIHSTIEDALIEILSYAEVEEEDFNEFRERVKGE